MKKSDDNTEETLTVPRESVLYAPYTGLGVKRRDPGKYDAIVRALRHGLSLRQCSDVFGIKKDVVGAICVRELGPGGMRKATEDNLRLLAHKASTDLLHDMDKISPAQKGVIMGIVLDKLERAEERQGQPASLTQNNSLHVHSPNISAEAVREFFSRIKSNSSDTTIDLIPNESSTNE